MRMSWRLPVERPSRKNSNASGTVGGIMRSDQKRRGKKRKSKGLAPSSTDNHNCYLAIDTRTDKVLASVEYERRSDGSIFLFGLDKTFKPRACGGEDPYPAISEAREQIVGWLYVYWNQWVPVPWKRWHRIKVGGGSGWSRKVLGAKRWHNKRKSYSFQLRRKSHGQDGT